MRISEEYIEAAAEVNEILKLMKKEDVEKIPLSLREFFFDLSKNAISVKINSDIPLNEQDLKPKTKALLGLLYRQFWCSEEERKKFDEKLLENDMKYKRELQNMYSNDVEDIFSQRKNNN